VPVRFVLIKLKDGVSVDDYERFIQAVDYPVVPSLETIRHYRTHRIRPEDKDPRQLPWDYVERIDVTDREAYQRELAASEGFAEFKRLNPTYVERAYAFWSDAVEPLEQA
jgi:hypothetical protein